MFASLASFLLFFACSPMNRSGVGGGSFFSCRMDPWWICCRAVKEQGDFNKSARRIPCLTSRWSCFTLAGHGGEQGKELRCLVMQFVLLPGENHAMDKLAVALYGQEGGRCSTSMAEALSLQRQCSAMRSIQVVRPRMPLVCWRLWMLVGKESPSDMSSNDLGGFAWRSPARCGGGAQGLDCVSIFSSRVLFVKSKVLSSNIRSFRPRVEKDLFVNCTCHVEL